MFSTTVTWNCRGRHMIAVIATPVCSSIAGQCTVFPVVGQLRRGAGLEKRSAKPS